MALRMKETEELRSDGPQPLKEGFIDMSDPTVTENKNPYVIHSTYVPTDKKEKASPLVLIIILLLVVGAAVGGILFVKNKYFSPIDLTADVRLPEEDFAKKYDLKFEQDDYMTKMVPRWTNSAVTVKSAGDIGLVYANGKRVGLHTSNKRYTIYGIKVGDADISVEGKMTFAQKGNFAVLNDIGQGQATTYYYYNWEKNEGIALAINDTSHRVVAITYFSDLKLMTETLSFD